MSDAGLTTSAHPTESELADYLSHSASGKIRSKIEDHIACCPKCLASIVCAYDSVKASVNIKKEKSRSMKKINICLVLAIISFALSFIVPQYFVQLLVATLLLGVKWVADAKSTKMLVMIYDAWKKGEDKEASRLLSALDPKPKNRL